MDEATRKLIAEYLQKAHSKLKAAEVLFQQGLFDDTVSRAYYAAFHAAQAVLMSEGQEAETHKGVMTLFGLFFIKAGKFPKKMGRFLTNLKDNRETGDYEALSWIDEETAERALAEAREFVQAMEGYLQKELTPSGSSPPSTIPVPQRRSKKK